MQTKLRDWSAIKIWILEETVRNSCEEVANPFTLRDATAQFSSFESCRLVFDGH